MADKRLSLFGIIGLVVLVFGYFFIVVPQSIARKDALTFSNTATWDPEVLALAKEPYHYPQDIFSNISLPPPPKNSSQDTMSEIRLLKSYRALRSKQEVSDIENEVNFSTTVKFAGHTFVDYEDGTQFPATAALLKDSFHDLTVIVAQQKEKFNRVRPNVLDPALDTVVPVPGHPAYPSGHSTQSHFIARVFGELAPGRKDEFTLQADRIAANREVAGVHYPSDTRAGILLSQQIFDALMKSPKFQTLLAAAKQEWVARGLTTASTGSTK